MLILAILLGAYPLAFTLVALRRGLEIRALLVRWHREGITDPVFLEEARRNFLQTTEQEDQQKSAFLAAAIILIGALAVLSS